MIHGLVDNRLVVPLVYVLMPNRRTETYLDVLNQLEGLGVTAPEIVFCDFEAAEIGAFRQKYGAGIKVCLAFFLILYI